MGRDCKTFLAYLRERDGKSWPHVNRVSAESAATCIIVIYGRLLDSQRFAARCSASKGFVAFCDDSKSPGLCYVSAAVTYGLEAISWAPLGEVEYLHSLKLSGFDESL